jgi:hypothetical protein
MDGCTLAVPQHLNIPPPEPQVSFLSSPEFLTLCEITEKRLVPPIPTSKETPRIAAGRLGTLRHSTINTLDDLALLCCGKGDVARWHGASEARILP